MKALILVACTLGLTACPSDLVATGTTIKVLDLIDEDGTLYSGVVAKGSTTILVTLPDAYGLPAGSTLKDEDEFKDADGKFDEAKFLEVCPKNGTPSKFKMTPKLTLSKGAALSDTSQIKNNGEKQVFAANLYLTLNVVNGSKTTPYKVYVGTQAQLDAVEKVGDPSSTRIASFDLYNANWEKISRYTVITHENDENADTNLITIVLPLDTPPITEGYSQINLVSPTTMTITPVSGTLPATFEADSGAGPDYTVYPVGETPDFLFARTYKVVLKRTDAAPETPGTPTPATGNYITSFTLVNINSVTPIGTGSINDYDNTIVISVAASQIPLLEYEGLVVPQIVTSPGATISPLNGVWQKFTPAVTTVVEYIVTPSSGLPRAYSVSVKAVPNPATPATGNYITSFTLVNINSGTTIGTGIIDNDWNTISIPVLKSQIPLLEYDDTKTLEKQAVVPQIVTSPGATLTDTHIVSQAMPSGVWQQFTPVGTTDFGSPITVVNYVVVPASGVVRVYHVSVREVDDADAPTVPPTGNYITSFTLVNTNSGTTPIGTGSINDYDNTIVISVAASQIPLLETEGLVVPQIVTSPGATISPLNGVWQKFTPAVTTVVEYIVTPSSGLPRAYSVSVKAVPNPATPATGNYITSFTLVNTNSGTTIGTGIIDNDWNTISIPVLKSQIPLLETEGLIVPQIVTSPGATLTDTHIVSQAMPSGVWQQFTPVGTTDFGSPITVVNYVVVPASGVVRVYHVSVREVGDTEQGTPTDPGETETSGPGINWGQD